MIRLSKEEQALFEQIHSSLESNRNKAAEEIEKGVEGVLGGRQISLRLAGAVMSNANFVLWRSPAKNLIWDIAIRAFDPGVVRKGIDYDKAPSESGSQRVVSAITEVYGGGGSKVQEQWNKLGLNQASYDERLVLYEVIRKVGLPCDFAIFVEDVARCSSLEERLDRCRDLSQVYDNSLKKDFSHHFHELGFIDDLNNCGNLERRLQLCEEIAGLGAWAAMGLATNFDKLDLQGASFQQKVALCRALAAQGTEAEEAVATHLSTILELEKEIERHTAVRERLDFCKETAQQGGWAARGLAANFDKLGLEEASLDERLELFHTIAEQGDDAENELVSHFSDKLGMVNSINSCKEVDDRFDICMKIVQQGHWGARAIAIFFDQLQLQEGSVEQRFRLCMAIAKQQRDVFPATPATYYLANSFDKLGLEKLPWQKRLSLLREIMRFGGSKTGEVNKLENFPLPQAFSDNLKDLLAKRAASGDYQVEESDDACDLLLIGTEIQGSCQRVDGDPNLNKGLTAYLMNGEIRAIAIKKEGKLVARSVMRLLWDSMEQSPVLLLERPYQNVRNNAIGNAIKSWAIDKAQAMGIPLVSKEFEGDTGKVHYDGTVEFLGGYAPFTYSDAAGGIIARAWHATIRDSYRLYGPPAASPLSHEEGKIVTV